jgi:hypothetical protein
MSLFSRALTEYFPRESLSWATSSLEDPPATVFLKEVAHICDSINHCAHHFPRKKNQEFTSDSADAFQRLSMSAFALLLSHFETFQREQFATILNNIDFMQAIDDVELAKRLEKVGCTLSLQRILTGRGEPREPGQIIADSLPGWHNPERVNSYFRVMLPAVNAFSNDVVTELELMWQLRHSIVHTGGVITREDAIKVAALRDFRDRRLKFDESFIPAVGRRFHIITEVTMQQLESAVRKVFIPLDSVEDTESIIGIIVGYDSPRRSWFRSHPSTRPRASSVESGSSADADPKV